MLTKINIGPRLVILIAIQTILLLTIGLTAIFSLNFAADTSEKLNKNVIEQVKLNQLNEVLRGDLLETVAAIENGKIDWEQGKVYLQSAKNLFENDWDEFKEDKNREEIDDIQASMGKEHQTVASGFDKLLTYMDQGDAVGFSDFVNNEMMGYINPFLLEVNEKVNEQQLISEQLFTEAIQKNKSSLLNMIIIMVTSLLAASILGYLIFKSISRPIKRISDTVDKVSDGDYYARTETKGSDELGQLAEAFDHLLEDKVATLVQAEKENEMLNESVISLLNAVSKLSQRDLTIKVPVTEDVTGPVADALNQLTTETSRVLQGVRRISEEVARSSALVKEKSDTVITVADHEKVEVDKTVQELSNTVQAMNEIASLAQSCNDAAEKAIDTTHNALQTVTSTVNGINDIRSTIHETEKRIKRLGERSQEISRAVNLINSISERTHILALNASMHAASAGEAGKGFAVVADEVQRLAENARDATAQISTLVSNIQVETADTVSTMNNVISQVVTGTQLAEQAGEQMQKTKESTENLVASVKLIASNSQHQAMMSNALQGRASDIQAGTRKTLEQLHEQTMQTNRLVEFSKSLLNAVQVFKLPELPARQPEKLPAKGSAVTSHQRKAS